MSSSESNVQSYSINTKILSLDEIYDSKTNKVDIQVLKTHLLSQGRLTPNAVISIISMATLLFKQEPNVLEISSDSINICGDVHGQYYDLIKLFQVGGTSLSNRYLFLGDYVDRGFFSIECILHLWSLKINRPNGIFLLRGNHECRHLSEYFTFKRECMLKYNQEVYFACMTSFDWLPLAALVHDQFLCLHGGLSPDFKTIRDIQTINRAREPPSSGSLCDILWADPKENYDEDTSDSTFTCNYVRGCSYSFSFNACCKFLNRNNLTSLIRAHEAQDSGYRMYAKNPRTDFPSLITIFSAPNYLDVYGNRAAILKYENNVLNVQQFKSSPHPYWLPNFMNSLTWSMPFVIEKVTDMLMVMLNVCTEDELMDDDPSIVASINQGRRDVIKSKIKAIGKLASSFSLLRDERECVLQLKGLTSNGLLPRGALSSGRSGIRDALENLGLNKKLLINNFEDAKMIDKINERMPPVLPSSDKQIE